MKSVESYCIFTSFSPWYDDSHYPAPPSLPRRVDKTLLSDMQPAHLKRRIFRGHHLGHNLSDPPPMITGHGQEKSQTSQTHRGGHLHCFTACRSFALGIDHASTLTAGYSSWRAYISADADSPGEKRIALISDDVILRRYVH